MLTSLLGRSLCIESHVIHLDHHAIRRAFPMRALSKTALIAEGQFCSSFEELQQKISLYKQINFTELWIRDCRTIKAAQGRFKKELNPDLKYYEYACVYGGGRSFNSRGSGLRTSSTMQQGCPFTIAVRVSKDGKHLQANSFIEDHHPVSELFDAESWTFTYLLGCAIKKEAILVDPVDTQVERDLKLLKELDLTLKYAVNTHCHADHVTGSGILKTMTACKSMIGKNAGAAADILLDDGDKITYGDSSIEAISTPGHTNGCFSYVHHQERFALTGDALLIRACGRTDFQEGNPCTLYQSVHSKLLSLPDDFLLFPAHDYKGHAVTTVYEEKKFNPRLTKSEEEFVEIMKNLGLAYPKKIDVALPWNVKCGPSQLGEARMDGL